MFYKESYVKKRFTESLPLHSISVPFHMPFNYTVNIDSSYTNNSGIITKYNDLRAFPKYESKVDSLVNTMMPHFFGTARGFGYNPQVRDSYINVSGWGKIDFMVDLNDIPILIIENKTDVPSSESWLDLMEQGNRYARNNDHMNVVFLMGFKGTYMACFFYDEDFHSNNGLDLKNPKYQDLIGLQVTGRGVSLIPQCNTYHPQLRIYNTSPLASEHDKLATSAILSYVSNFRKLEGIEDDFSLPSNNGPDRILATCSYVNHPGMNFALKVDPFGRFKL